MDNVRHGVTGVNTPMADTSEAEKLQAKLPKKAVDKEEKTVFEGAGTFYIEVKEGSPKVEVRFKQNEGGRYSTSDKDIIEALKKRGFKIISKEQLEKEREEKFKQSRNKKATNASMQDYLDMKIEKLKIEFEGAEPLDIDSIRKEIVNEIKAEIIPIIEEVKRSAKNNKDALAKRVDRLKEKLEDK